jgi:hypothetical protein
LLPLFINCRLLWAIADTARKSAKQKRRENLKNLEVKLFILSIYYYQISLKFFNYL